MNALSRNIREAMLADLRRKFVFLSGPRQVGKTTLAKKIMREVSGRHLLYDDDEDRRIILRKEYTSLPWVCLDEFHKFPRWKNHIKGVYDKHHETLHLLLTGSARLDVFQKSGDSLFGRYYLHHLHPLTCGELNTDVLPKPPDNGQELHDPIAHLPELMQFGGFPEPFGLQSETEHRRWSNARRQLLVREDLREMSHIELIGLVEQLMLLLPDRIGSFFSYRSLAEDIRVSSVTIQNWMNVFERLFFVFKIRPYSRKLVRSIQRQPKYYFYDWSQVTDEGGRFENLIASHLWKAVQIWTDRGQANFALHHVRDRDNHEVDFLITKDRQPWLLVEAQLSETQLSGDLRYFSRRLGVPGLQIVLKNDVYRREDRLIVASANRWLGHLP